MATLQKLTKKLLLTLKERESKRFAKSINLDDKIECNSKNLNFITLKDHKENSRNNAKCRLINPLKSEVGPIMKKYLSNIISEVKEKAGVNQWRKTFTVIDWFKNVGNKNKRKFIKFYIAELYPSISEELLDNANMQNGTLIFVKMLLPLLSLHASSYFSTKKLLGLKKV